VVFNNLSPERRTVRVDLAEDEIPTATDLFTDRSYERIDPKRPHVHTDGRSYRWLRIREIY